MTLVKPLVLAASACIVSTQARAAADNGPLTLAIRAVAGIICTLVMALSSISGFGRFGLAKQAIQLVERQQENPLTLLLLLQQR